MSTLVGTSRAVVVGDGSGPGPVSPPPPEAAPACWTNPTYFETWVREPPLTQETGCSSSGYPWSDDLPPTDGNELLTVDGSWQAQVLGDPTVNNGSDIVISTNLPFDPIQSTYTFNLTQKLAITSDVDNSDWFYFNVYRDATAGGGGVQRLEFLIISQSNQTHFPLGESTQLVIGSFTTTNTTTGLFLTGGATVTITVTPTQLSLSIAGGPSLTLSPWVPVFGGDPATVVTNLVLEEAMTNGEGPFDPAGSPNSAFTTIVGPIQILAPLGNCQTVDRC